MHKLLSIAFFFFCLGLFAQDKKEAPSLENFQRKYRYAKNRTYEGPQKNYNYPSNMRSEYDSDEQNMSSFTPSSGSNGGKSTFSEEDFENFKRKQQQENGGNGSEGLGEGGTGIGPKKKDPKMGMPEPIEFNPPNPPDIDAPDIDIPDVDKPTFSPYFWRTLLIILLIIAVLVLAYFIIKNYRPKPKRLVFETTSDWNPEVITKTELELRLEQAMAEDNYRECVRIYFTFILKEMIRLKRIRWKKELTNYDYLLQCMSKPGYPEFRETVHIYDLVWYGDYNIGMTDYKQLETHLQKNYSHLSSLNA